MARAILVLAFLFPQPQETGLRRPDPGRHPDVWMWTDVCNVYVIKDGDAALLVDLGDGSVLDRLGEIGVKTVEWVLFTHHHREQLQGWPKLAGRGVKVGSPEAERELFERPSRFRKMDVRLNDRYTIHGTSYVRPPIAPVPVDRGFRKMDVFEWRGREILCVETKGNSPGAMTYLLRSGDRWSAFSGDLMLADARMHTWFDTEWDYGFASGIYAITNSAGQIQGYDPAWLFPSHGDPVKDAAPLLEEYQRKLRRLEKLYVRGYDVHTFSAAVQDRYSKPTAVPFVWQVSPHLYKLRGPGFSPNLNLIVADSGRALAVDCGLLDPAFLDRTLKLMQERLGLKGIDAMIATHMHGDHFLQGPWLRETWGAKLWAIDRMGPVCATPERFDYCAPIQAYGTPVQRVTFDRLFKDGETVEWEGFRFTVDWMPGQTEFALGFRGVIDGKTVVFTGDNIFGDPEDPTHTGHEAVVAHNSAIFEEGYIYGAEYLSRVKPDLLMGGHSFVMDKPAGLIERYRTWSYEIRDAFRALSPDEDYRYFFDPYWVRAEPYRLKVKRGQSAEVSIHVRNFRSRAQTHRIELHGPPGLSSDPPAITGELGAGKRGVFTAALRASADAPAGVQIVALDVTLDGRRYGQLFDLIVEIE